MSYAKPLYYDKNLLGGTGPTGPRGAASTAIGPTGPTGSTDLGTYANFWPGSGYTIPANYSEYNISVQVGFHGSAISLPNFTSQQATYYVYGSSSGSNTYTVIFPITVGIVNVKDGSVITGVTIWNFILNQGQYVKFFPQIGNYLFVMYGIYS